MSELAEVQDAEPSSQDGGYESVGSSVDSEDDYDDSQYGTMARFVPTLVLERLRALGEAAAVPKKCLCGGVEASSAAAAAAAAMVEGFNSPKAHELDAAVMVVDISGFSGMCERFAQGLVPDGGWRQRMKGIPSLSVSASGSSSVRRSGASHASVITSLYRLSNDKETKGFGAEGVRDALNLALGELISTVEKHGGDVLRIAGDALIVLFHQGEAGISQYELANLCSACTRCGWDCAASSVGAGGDGAEGGVGLSVHVGVGCGRVSCFHVGSDRLGWQLVVSGELFENQVAKALDVSGAGEVVVSAPVWQHLAGTGWGSGPAGGPSASDGLRLLHWTPDPGGGPGPGCWDDDSDGIDLSGRHGLGLGGRSAGQRLARPGEEAGSTAPAHGQARRLSPGWSDSEGQGGSHSHSDSLPPAGVPRPSVARRSSYSGAGRVGPAAAAAAAGAAAATAVTGGFFGPTLSQSHGRATSLDHAAGAVGSGVAPGGRWCPSRRRISLLEEVETGVLTMLSKEVGRALRGYCPQPIREGLVAERLGLLAELQRVAVLFVGLSFERVGCSSSNGNGKLSQAQTAPSATPTPITAGRILDGGGLTPPDPGASSGSISAELTPTGSDSEAEAAAVPTLAQASGRSPAGSAREGADLTAEKPKGVHLKVAEAEAGTAKAATEEDESSVVSLELLQGSFSLLQSIVASHGGVIKELSVDDKGTVLVVGFGLSPQVGHLPAARATLCAMECTDRLRAKGLARCHAGVATGPVFCGSLGSEDRREFAMISETVNLAQRLMSARKNRRLLPKAGHQANMSRSYSSNDIKASSKGHDRSARGEPSGPANVHGRKRRTKKRSDGVGASKDVHERKGLVSSGNASRIVRDEVGRWARKSTLAGRQGAPRQEKQGVYTLAHVASTPTMSSQIKGQSGEGGEDAGGKGGNAWQEGSFNRWVVLEAETLKEARKTDQLAFLELEAIKVKGKTSNVDVFAPSLADDVVAAVAAAAERALTRSSSTPTTPSRADSSLPHHLSARFRTASSGHDGSIMVGNVGASPDFASRVATPAAPPPGVIMGGVGGGGSRVRPAPPLPVILSDNSGGSATSKEADVIRGQGGRSVHENGSFSLDKSSRRYRLESPRKGDWEGGEGSRGSGSGSARAWGDGELLSPENAGEQNLGADPLPDAAAKRFASWRKTRHLGVSGLPGSVTGGAAASRVDPLSSISPGAAAVARLSGGAGGADGMWGRAGGETGGDVLSREAFEALLPCIFHADAVHDEVSHILWARTRGRVSYLADLCKSLIGVTRCAGNGGGAGSGGCTNSFGQVGEDGTWRLRLNEFAHVLKLASRVPPGVEGALQRRLDELPYNARQVVLRVVCVTVVAGVGETALLLHLLTNVAPFKEYWKAVVAQHESGDTPGRRRGSRSRSRRRISIPPRRSFTLSPVLVSSRTATAATNAAATAAALSHRQERGDSQEPTAAEAAATTAQAAGNIAAGGVSPSCGLSTTPAGAAASPETVAAAVELLGNEHGGRRLAAVFGGRLGHDGETKRSTPSSGEPEMLTPPRTPPPASPVGSKSKAVRSGSGSGAGEEALRSCLAMLEAGGFLRVCEGGEFFICDDAMLMDQVYASTPFKLRKGLHKEAAQWISDRHRRDFRDRADVMPVLINHLTQAHEEARAQAQLAVLKVLGGRFLDRWVLEHVRPLVSIRVNPRNPSASEHLALCVLPALPSLRGLSKAIRGAEIAGVVVGVALRLRSLRFKDMDKMAKPRQRRSLSISGSSFKTNASDESPRSITNDRSSALFKRRSASLAGSAVAPCPSELVQPLTSSLSLPLSRAASNKDGFEIVITGSSSIGIEATDSPGDRAGDAGDRDLVTPPDAGASRLL